MNYGTTWFEYEVCFGGSVRSNNRSRFAALPTILSNSTSIEVTQMPTLNANVTSSTTVYPKDRGQIISPNEPKTDCKTNSVIPVVVCACILLTVFFGSNIPALKWLYAAWTSGPDNSHGFLVPIFSLWLLWHRRSFAPNLEQPISRTAIIIGIGLIIAGMAIRCAGIYMRMISAESVALLPTIAGIFCLCAGLQAGRWAWPSILFLFFMIPIPGPLGGLLSGLLQRMATISSTYLLQMAGIPAVSEGNLILLTEKTLGVAEACSGIRMLTSFFALSVGMSLSIARPTWEKILISVSAPVIAIIANILRISATAIAYEYGSDKMAELIFHDLAGWLMMPVGLFLLWIELFLIAKLFPKDESNEVHLGSIVR